MYYSAYIYICMDFTKKHPNGTRPKDMQIISTKFRNLVTNEQWTCKFVTSSHFQSETVGTDLDCVSAHTHSLPANLGCSACIIEVDTVMIQPANMQISQYMGYN